MFYIGECGKLDTSTYTVIQDTNWQSICETKKSSAWECAFLTGCILDVDGGYNCEFTGASTLCADDKYKAASGTIDKFDIGCDSSFKCSVNLCNTQSTCCYCYSTCLSKIAKPSNCIPNGLTTAEACI